MCTRLEMRKIVSEVMPEYNEDEIESAVGICMARCNGYDDDISKIKEAVKHTLKETYRGSRGYDLKKNYYCLLN